MFRNEFCCERRPFNRRFDRPKPFPPGQYTYKKDGKTFLVHVLYSDGVAYFHYHGQPELYLVTADHTKNFSRIGK